MRKNRGQRIGFATLALLVLLTLLLSGTALAGQFESTETYRLEAGQVINDDLYVAANQIFIDGVVNGDIYAAAGYIEINGSVAGDVVLAAGGIKITGVVMDDARLAAGGIDITGSIGDDLLVAGGGQPGGFSMPIQTGGRTVIQGIRLGESARVGGDALFGGGAAEIRGQIQGDLYAATGTLSLDARVGGNARLNASTLSISNNSRIEGSLTYSAPSEGGVPAGVAGRIEYQPEETEETRSNPFLNFFWWSLRTVAILAGFGLVGWLLLRLSPRLLEGPAASIEANPVEAGLWGLLVFGLFMALPVASAVIVALVALFWGWGPAVVALCLLFGSLGIIWIFSPLVTGLWLGRKIAGAIQGISGALPAFLVGMAVIVLVGRVPCVGWLAAFFSFVLAMGGMVQSLRAPAAPPPLAEEQPLLAG